MKLGTLSLVAVMALGTSAYAIENVKVTGEIKAIYQTTDLDVRAADGETASTGMFDNGNKTALGVSPYNGSSAGGIGGTLGLTADLTSNVSAGAEMQIYTTLGLDSNVFNDNMINADYASTGFTADFDKRTQDASNVSQLWLAATAGKTTLKAGRMELNTPLLFTEKWNVAKNTFESLVAINTDLPDTTLIGAWVGKHNGHGSAAGEGGNLLAGSPGRTVNMEEFRTFFSNGAYAAGAINKSIPETTLQAWYYNIVSVADAYWLQADTKVAGMVTLGAQYAALNPDGANDSSIYAVKAGVDVSGINLYAAYSKADDDGVLGFANTATADKTNIYTGAGSIYFDGVLTAPGVEAIKVGVSGSVADVKLAAAYVTADDKYDKTVDGFNLTAGTKAGPVGLTAIFEQVNNGADDTVIPTTPGSPFYKGRDIQTLRLVASYKF
jgi:hypothetical protein